MDESREQKLRIALLRLLNLESLRLFGGLIYNFNIKVLHTETVRLQIDKQLPDLDKDIRDQISQILTDGSTAFVTIENNQPQLRIYDTFIDTKTTEELTYVCLHEILHILDGHTYRSRSLDGTLFNLAADHVINKALNEDIKKGILKKVSIPDDAFTLKELLNKNMSTEEVYDYLKSKATVNKQKVHLNLPASGTGTGQTSKDNGDSEGQDNSVAVNVEISEVEINGKTIQTVTDIQSSDDKSSETQDRTTVEALKAEARASINSHNEKSRGSQSGALSKLLSSIIEVDIPWEVILERALLTKLVDSKDTRTWARPNRKLFAHGFVLPGNYQDWKTSVGVIAMDMSGSISDKDIKKFANIVITSLQHFDSIWIIKHDVRIHDQLTISSDEIEAGHFALNTKGRGGTSHKYVFNEIQKSFESGESDIGIVILLTDFDSDVHRIWDTYEWVKRIPVCVCLTRNNNVPETIDPKPILIESK